MPQEKFYGGNKIKAAVIDADQLVAAQARDIGDAKMSESKDQLDQNRITKFVRRIWKQNLMEGYYRNKEIQKARKDIIENKNLYHGEAEIANQAQNKNSHKEAMDAIVEGFTSEYENEMLRQEERDSREKAGAPLNTAIKDLIKKYASTPTMDKAAFEEEKNRLINTHNPKYAKENSLYADNLFDIANEVKQAVAQGEKLDQMDFEVDLTFGKARESLNTEGKKTTLDKLFGDNKFGKAISQNAILAGAVAGAYSLTKALTMNYGKRAAKWFGFGAGLAAGAIVEGVKENARVNRERSQNMRENAKGMKFTDPDMERRQEMAKNLYETKNATAIISELDGDLNLIKTGNVSEADMQSAFGRIAELEARISLGDAQKIDLISYDHYGNVEKDRKKIGQRLGEIKVAIRKETATNPKAFMNGASYDDYISGITTDQVKVFSEGDIAKKDKIFRGLKTRRIIRKMGQTMLMGAAISFAGQELGALLTSRDGVIEGGAKSIYNHFSDESNHGADLHKNATALEALRRNLFGESPRMSTEHMHEAMVGATHMQLPDGADIVDNGNGTYDFVRDGVVISNDIPLNFDSNGNLSPESIALLQKNDIYTDFYKIHDPDGNIDGNGAKNPSEWVEQHKDSMHRIHRHFMDNDTPMEDNPAYPGDPRHRFGSNLNELRADWGGVNNTGVTEDGNYAFNVHRMTDDGSFHGDASVSAHKEMVGENLKMLLSVSKDSQQYVFEVDVDKYGNAIVDKDSEIGKMLFTTDATGHAVYTGAYAEIAHMNADVTYPDGGEDMDILATHIGDDAAHIPHEDVPYVKFDLPDDTDYDPPYPIPIVPRRPLERGKYKKPIIATVYDESYLDRGPIYADSASGTYIDSSYGEPLKVFYEDEEFKFIPNEVAKEAKKKMNPEDLKRYLDNMKGYVEKGMDINMMEELNKQIGEPMDNETKISISLPCYKEGTYIYKTLSDWTLEQKDLKPEELEIIALVNAPKKDQPLDPKTISEIERFKKDHPKYKVRLVQHNFDFESGVKMGSVYKAVSDLSMYRNMKRLEAGASPEVVASHLMRAGGADALGRNPRFLREVIDFMENHQETEQLRSQSAYPPEVREKFPLFNLVTVFNHSLSQLYTRGSSNIGLGTFRSRMYAEAEGFNPNASMKEEIDLGVRIREKLKNNPNAINKLVKKNAIDNPRRELFALAKGDTVLYAYKGFADPERDAELKAFDWNKEIPENFKKNVEMNKENMNREFDAYFQHFHTKILRESGVIAKVISGELTAKVAGTAQVHPELRLLLRDPEFKAMLKEVDAQRKAGKKITRSSKEIKKLTEHATKQIFDRIIRTTFKLRKGPDGDYNYVEGADKNLHIVFNEKSISKLNKSAKEKWENFDGYWGKKKDEKEADKTAAEASKVEKMSSTDFKDLVEKSFKDILSKEDKATIEKFSVNFEGNRIVGHTELKAKNSLGGKPVIDLDIMSNGKDFVFSKTGNKIRANNLARGSVNEAVAGIPDKIKEVLEKKYKQKIDSISIEGGEIKLTFE